MFALCYSGRSFFIRRPVLNAAHPAGSLTDIVPNYFG
uniref:Uncharacterized protein n=1 Tax=Anguilla anguilla TaxID=7936 RepID=A0A0E9TJV6_ANGAN